MTAGDGLLGLVKPPDFVITFDKQIQVYQNQNLTFDATFGDYCVDFVLPKTPLPDTSAAAGLSFWAKDYDNYFLVMAANNGTISLYKRAAGVFSTIFTAPADNSPFKAEPDAVNLRVIVSKDGKLTISLNGKPVKVIRALAPQGTMRFGFMAELDGKPPDAPTEIRLKGYKVIAGN
ncbi:MAG TPA: hypothetical protein VFE60_18290 [Roseiarcus sp.]|jgi:hypothetical protein|nr:hypothetical protein [Roseiarcus sp.]